MTELSHDLLIGKVIHPPQRFEFANEAARLAATGFVAGDLYKLALDLDTCKATILTGIFPVVWKPLLSLPLEFGTKQFWNSTKVNYLNIIKMTDSKFVISYRDAFGSYRGQAIVGIDTGAAISFGTPVYFSTGTVGTMDSARINDNQFIIGYNRYHESPTQGAAVIGTISGTVITYGSITNLDGNSGPEAAVNGIVSIEVLSSTRFVMGYYGSSSLSSSVAVVGVISGSTITSFGTARLVPGALSFINVKRLSDTSFLYSGESPGANSSGMVYICTVSGTSISAVQGPSYINGPPGIGKIYGVTPTMISPSFVVFTFLDWQSSMQMSAIVGEISGGTVTFGTKKHITNAQPTGQSAVLKDASNLVCSYFIGGKYSSRIGAITGKEIVFGPAIDSDLVDSLGEPCSILLPGKIITAFSDNKDSTYYGAIIPQTVF